MSAYLKILQNYLETKGVKNEKIFQQHKLLIELINDYNKVMSVLKFFDVALVPLMPCGFVLTFLKPLKRSGTISFDSFQRIILIIIPHSNHLFVWTRNNYTGGKVTRSFVHE
ncbi:hypothetical protein O3M35_003694 [Rhynocoris fuscipes]|uniref:Uncharacterized protein n=1 Tax=Rhynocoris fuscipes TaxID=488301 RepID=A0AAW1CJY9_9HEMI